MSHLAIIDFIDTVVNMVANRDGVTISRMTPLDPDDPRPTYAQVADALRREIEQGILQPGTKLPSHQQLVAKYDVSTGTVKRALGELQGARLIISRQGQGAYVRTQRSSLDSVSPGFSPSVLGGLWVTSYQFQSRQGIQHHADITRLTPQSDHKLTAKNYPPSPRTEGHAPPFRNAIDVRLANRHLIGNWRNMNDTRYFGALHLAVLPGEAEMEGYYTGLTTDIHVGAMSWRWVRLEVPPHLTAALPDMVLKEPTTIFALLTSSVVATPIPLAAVTEESR